MARVDYDSQAVAYEAGRGVPLSSLFPWRKPIERTIPRGTSPIIDLGAGTGIWTRALSVWFTDARILAVEPSKGMQAVGIDAGLPAGAVYVNACAEALPLRDRSCRAAWLSTVVHHLTDLRACARELRRVLRAGSPAMIRNTFPGRQDEVELFRFFPAAAAVAAAWPTLGDVRGAFAESGFSSCDVQRVREPRWADLTGLRSWALSMRRTDSTLAPITDAEFADGLRRLDEAVADGDSPRAGAMDLVILR